MIIFIISDLAVTGVTAKKGHDKYGNVFKPPEVNCSIAVSSDVFHLRGDKEERLAIPRKAVKLASGMFRDFLWNSPSELEREELKETDKLPLSPGEKSN